MLSYDLSPIHTKLLDQHVVELAGEVNNDMARHVHVCMAHLVSSGSPDIIVKIASTGGMCAPGFDIYDMLRLYPGKTTAQVVNCANSMASIILQACNERQCAEHATILIHDMHRRVSYGALKSKKRTKRARRNLRRHQRAAIAVLSKRTGQSKKRVRKEMAKDEPMPARKAKEFGLIDKVV